MPAVTHISGVPVLAVGEYRGTLRAAIRAAKHGGCHALARRFAPQVAALARRLRADIAIPVPSSREGRLARGYSVPHTLARATGLRSVPALTMVDGASQRGLGRTERTRLRAMRVVNGAIPPGSTVVLVDDVMATGATIRSAIDSCASSGIRVVGVIVLARSLGATTRGETLAKSAHAV